jgi:hypothetical protein
MRQDSRERNNDTRGKDDANHRVRMTAEYRRLCEMLRERIAEGGFPPDEAYWWTRIALREAALLQHTT